jgi:hypothetical protein
LALVAGSAAASDEVAPLGTYSATQRGHWAFVARGRPEAPRLTPPEREPARNPIDAFVLARLRAEGLRPAPRAAAAVLIRRVSFDLTGLPPTPAEVAAFVADRSPDAYDRLVERLLGSPHYGERWGQHWLDVARFAETDGFEYDTHRREAWRYRDYVVDAFNADKPYDRFILEQLAGDEIAPETDEARIAAGFNRLGPLRRNAGNQEVASSRNEVLTEMTNGVGSVFLGVTLGCARCHDHMFDPIKQSDYYRIEAYFASTHDRDVPKYTAAEETAWKARVAPIDEEITKLKAALKSCTPDAKPAIEKKIEALEDGKPVPLPALFSVAADPGRVSPIHVLARGDYQHKGARVGMRPLGVLLPDGAPELAGPVAHPRAELARWIASPENPLTARVVVNRVWHYHFGRGIVATPNDFGRRGARPTHPELLDYLANELVAARWSIKHLHRLILSSATYQQASTGGDPAALAKDPENTLLGRFTRRRLEAEEIRDAMLAAAGNLNPRQGGPSVMVPVDPALLTALYKPAQWAVTADPAEHARRSLYLIRKRNLRLPFMEAFDAPDAQVSCPRRESSTHAPQALELLNGGLANRQAELLAARLRAEAGEDRRAQVDLAYRLVAGRGPEPREEALALGFLERMPLGELALAMFNLNAFLYVE